MMVVNVYELGHEMCLIGIERIEEDTYNYIFSNSWGGTGIKIMQGSKLFLHVNETLIPHVDNPEILGRQKLVHMQIDELAYSVNGKEYISDVAPFIENSRTMIPLRAVLEALGYEVEWVNDTREINVYKK